MTEKRMYQALRRAGGQKIIFTRHEDRISSGIPDLSFICQSGSGWLEQKWIQLPKRNQLAVVKNVRTAQVNWLLTMAGFGSQFIGMLLGFEEDKKVFFYIVEPQWLASFFSNQLTYGNLIGPFDAALVVDFLTRRNPLNR